jgi:L-iditol 2-dehydrogenase
MGTIVMITGTQRDEERLQLAKRLGADHCLQVHQQGILPIISHLTEGYGVEIAFECSGAASAVDDCRAAVRKGGEIIQVGLFGQPISCAYDEYVLKEIQLKGSFAHNRGSWEEAIRLLQDRKVSLSPLISGEFPLDQWREGFQLFEKGKGLKYLLNPLI